MNMVLVGSIFIFALLLPHPPLLAQQASSASEKNQISTGGPLIPQHLSHAAEFVKFLQEAGAVVQEVGICHCNGMFRGDIKTAFIRTDKGIAEINIFPGERDAEKITFTVSKEEGRTYKYSFYGQPTLGDNIMSSCCPYFIITYRNWFIMTRDAPLHALISEQIGEK